MLAPTIGTMHGPNKGKPGQKVKLNITLAHELLKVANKINNDIIFVAHGASTLYPDVINYATEKLNSIKSQVQELSNKYPLYPELKIS